MYKTKSIIIYILLISIVTSISAQNRGISLPYFSLDGSDWNGSILWKLTAEEYSNMEISKCKHKLLRNIPLQNILKGKVILENEAGKVQIIYGVQNYSDRLLLLVHTYLFSLDKNGKYIDSIYTLVGSDITYQEGGGYGSITYTGNCASVSEQLYYLIKGVSMSDALNYDGNKYKYIVIKEIGKTNQYYTLSSGLKFSRIN